jgi:hypothetical protein
MTDTTGRIGHSSCLLAQRPGMDVMLSPYGEPRGGRAFIADNPKGKHGAHNYSPEE